MRPTTNDELTGGMPELVAALDEWGEIILSQGNGPTIAVDTEGIHITVYPLGQVSGIEQCSSGLYLVRYTMPWTDAMYAECAPLFTACLGEHPYPVLEQLRQVLANWAGL